MLSRRLPLTALLPFALAALAPAASAAPQNCTPQLLSTFDLEEGTSGRVRASCVFDDGRGPALYIAGDFTEAGGVLRNRIARWDGQRWTSLGSGLNASVWDLEVFDDGSGPKLYAAGDFTTAGGNAANRIARWNGQQWSALGSGLNAGARALEVFVTPSGPRLFVGGDFTTAGGPAAARIAAWSGSGWSALGAGVNQTVHELKVHFDGSSQALYVGGAFTTAGGNPASGIARWSGTSWSALGSGVAGTVFALASFNEGPGPGLHVGGTFATAGGSAAPNNAIWRGGVWTAGPAIAGGSTVVEEFGVADVGFGPRLFALATNSFPWSLQHRVAGAWQNWGTLDGPADTLLEFDEGSGTRLFVGGSFFKPNEPYAHNLVRYASTGWEPVGNGIDGYGNVMAVHDDGGGPELYVAGYFVMAGTERAGSIAKWDGRRWTPLGSGAIAGIPGLGGLASYNDGTGPALYMGGTFTSVDGVPANRVARWDGASWSAVGGGLAGAPRAFEAFDDGSGPALWAAGSFDFGTSQRSFAKWDGVSWTDIGAVLGIDVYDLQVWDDGSGPALYVAGEFTTVAGVTVNHVAKWDGATWSALGTGLSGSSFPRALALTIYMPPGGTPALYVGGSFTTAGGVAASGLARWNGTSWSAVSNQALGFQGSGLPPTVNALTTTQVGGTPRLVVAGSFNLVGALPARNLVLWNGSSWLAPSNGSDFLLAALEHDDGTGAKLFATGPHTGTTTAGVMDILTWGCAVTSAGQAYCTSGTSAAGCTPVLSSTGTASASAASGFTLTATGVDGQRSGLVYYGVSGGMAGPWGNGSSRLCVRPPRGRLPVLATGGNAGLCDGVLAIDWNAWRLANPVAVGQPLVAGEQVWAQAWYRDPASPLGSSLTGGVVFSIGP